MKYPYEIFERKLPSRTVYIIKELLPEFKILGIVIYKARYRILTMDVGFGCVDCVYKTEEDALKGQSRLIEKYCIDNNLYIDVKVKGIE
tara:strand:+ start:281 stop:547 length:267 start_codon:yes stop_codon:yes gene_type:complete